MKKNMILLAIVPALIFTACKKENEEEMMDPQDNLTLNFTNLAPSASGEQYEGWIIVNGSPVSTGTFTVDANGDLSKSTFTVDENDLAAATDFVLSIEPMPDNDPAPSAIKILGGAFSGNSANITSAHPAALGNDFSTVGGTYILATPTTGTMDDELSGVWFLSLASGSPMTGLDLPDLPSGWKYEGWAVIDGMPVTTGTFSMADMGDDSAPFSGSDSAAPPFPGEDFVSNAPSGKSFPTNLQGATVVISIEPYPDNSPDPFAFKPLVGMAPADAADHSDYSLTDHVSESFPTGMVIRK
jgi:hypothetical protein